MFSFLSVSVFMFTVYCLVDPCGLISNKDDEMIPSNFADVTRSMFNKRGRLEWQKGSDNITKYL